MANFGVLAVLACVLALASAQTITVHPGLAVSGSIYIQHVTPSLVSGAGGMTPGGGGRRLLEAPGRSLLQLNASTTEAEAAGTAAAGNAVLSSNSGRKLLQTTGLQVLYAAKKDILTGRVTVVLELPATAGNAAILTAFVTPKPAGIIVNPATFFNAEVSLGAAVAVSKTGFIATAGGVVRVRLSFDLQGDVMPPMQMSWQYASNLPAPNAPFFFLNVDQTTIVVDKAGLPTFKGLVDTLHSIP